MSSESAGGLTRLIVKDPVYANNKAPIHANLLTANIVENGKCMFRLKELVLQSVGLNKKDVV